MPYYLLFFYETVIPWNCICIVNPCNEQTQWKEIIYTQHFAWRRKLKVLRATSILLVHNLKSNQFIQLWWCLKLKYCSSTIKTACIDCYLTCRKNGSEMKIFKGPSFDRRTTEKKKMTTHKTGQAFRRLQKYRNWTHWHIESILLTRTRLNDNHL